MKRRIVLDIVTSEDGTRCSPGCEFYSKSFIHERPAWCDQPAFAKEIERDDGSTYWAEPFVEHGRVAACIEAERPTGVEESGS